MSRSASSSYKGYTYQRARLLYLIFCKYYDQSNSISFQEENLEDIDFFITTDNGTNQIHLYQEKYYNTDDDESLNIDSGLTKVIISHYDTENITEINYDVVSTSGKTVCTSKLKNFLHLIEDDDNNKLIGKFIALNYCYGNLFSYQPDYNKFITKLKNNTDPITDNIIDDKIKYKNSDNNNNNANNTNTNIYKLKQFCRYCLNDDNINNLIIYLKKIKFFIYKNEDNTFINIHKKTIDKLKTILPEFNEMCSEMSNQYNEFYSETLYGLFEMICVKNLFKSNDKMTVQDLINNIKNKINNSTTDNDKLIIIIHTMRHFINNNQYDILNNRLFETNAFVNYILNNKITMTNFICKFNKEGDVNNEYIQKKIRQTIYDIVLLKKYNLVDDKALLFFLYRSYKTIKFTGNSYKSLKKFDDIIKNHNKS